MHGFLARLGVELPDLLITQALTHRSFSYENGGEPHNERLEFLGDSILGQAVTVKLFRDHPDLSEGTLAKRRSSLVSSVALAEVGRHIGLGVHLRLGRGEELTGGREKDSILADTVEAIIGAVFVGLGPEVANTFVLDLVTPLFADPDRFGAAMDPKTSLQEAAAERGLNPPQYSVTGEGPDHDRIFTAVVSVGSVKKGDAVGARLVAGDLNVLVSGHGVGSSKKQAEIAAALDAWTVLNRETSEGA
ncbi:ribonuclease III [Klugiella xanthotipulae]|uniref:Ribonuclease 3 n=1 Tax=Klugiella xanthotipulae TaxID=244735 RepID=A0A543HRS9_9MICO|nr:ribonuclease III [Klugiella xanthotipulae]TQM61057.1 RNAse III [Klugiella xanthotipulae]